MVSKGQRSPVGIFWTVVAAYVGAYLGSVGSTVLTNGAVLKGGVPAFLFVMIAAWFPAKLFGTSLLVLSIPLLVKPRWETIPVWATIGVLNGAIQYAVRINSTSNTGLTLRRAGVMLFENGRATSEGLKSLAFEAAAMALFSFLALTLSGLVRTTKLVGEQH